MDSAPSARPAAPFVVAAVRVVAVVPSVVAARVVAAALVVAVVVPFEAAPSVGRPFAVAVIVAVVAMWLYFAASCPL